LASGYSGLKSEPLQTEEVVTARARGSHPRDEGRDAGTAVNAAVAHRPKVLLADRTEIIEKLNLNTFNNLWLVMVDARDMRGVPPIHPPPCQASFPT
jgi:hypothetical protein